LLAIVGGFEIDGIQYLWITRPKKDADRDERDDDQNKPQDLDAVEYRGQKAQVIDQDQETERNVSTKEELETLLDSILPMSSFLQQKVNQKETRVLGKHKSTRH